MFVGVEQELMNAILCFQNAKYPIHLSLITSNAFYNFEIKFLNKILQEMNIVMTQNSTSSVNLMRRKLKFKVIKCI